MDSNDWRQTQQPPGDGAGGDWRSQLRYHSRQMSVKTIMDTLKCNLPSSGQQGVQVLWKIAMEVEEKIYLAATSQSDYLRRVSVQMRIMKSKPNAPGTMSSAIPSNSAGISETPQDLASLDSNAQTGVSELEEEVYLKVKIMEELAGLHYSEIHGIYQKVCSKIQQHDSLSLQAKSDGAVMLNSMKDMLEHIMQCFQMSRITAQTFCNDKLRGLEKQSISIIDSRMPRQPSPPLPQGPQITQAQSHENGINSQLQSVHVQGSSVSSLNGITSFQPNMMNTAQLNLKLELGRGNAPAETPSAINSHMPRHPSLPLQRGNAPAETSSTSSDSTAPTNISESQEEVYQKMQGMKNLYLQEVQGIYEKICLKVQQEESLSQQAKSVGLSIKRKVELIIECLQMSRSTAQRFQKDQLAGLEKQILSFINLCRPKSSRWKRIKLS